ncbi:MAG: hypothetical protein NTV01_01270 [Bacteroidia bacterium]|nr:hypothetical protein [Bacteroidia bacterium]
MSQQKIIRQADKVQGNLLKSVPLKTILTAHDQSYMQWQNLIGNHGSMRRSGYQDIRAMAGIGQPKVGSSAISTLENDDDSVVETCAPSIMTEYAIETPNPQFVAVPLTADKVQDAIRYNRIKLGTANAALIGTLRDVLGISRTPAVIDEDFVNAVGRWQAEQNLEQDGKLGPDTAAPLFRELRAEGLTNESRSLASLIRRGRVKTGPTYNPHGVLTPTASGVTKSVPFAFTAEFDHDPVNGIWASCCETRQKIRWNAAAATSFTAITGLPRPHAGFPAAHPADTWIEDRNSGDTIRYGHRRSFGGGVAGNRFVNGRGALSQASGIKYEGHDTPTGPSTMAGQWRFRVSVVDVCNENKQIGGTDNITINW